MSDARTNPGHGSAPPRYPGSFLLALREALAAMGWQPRRWLGVAVECADEENREQVLGLENLYRRLRREDRAQWPQLIVEMLRSVPAESNETIMLDDAADRILVRIGPPMAPTGAADKDIWFQPVLGKRLGLTLVIDQPSTMSYVNMGQLDQSGREPDYWLAQALANLRARTPADAVATVHEESKLLQIEVGDAYDSSRALILETLLPEHRRHGYLVALPGRDHLFVLPVDRQALEYIAWLRMIAAKTYQTVPYAISPEVYWIRAGVWRLFAIEVRQDKVMVTPPPEFEEVLRQLSPELMDPPDET